MPLEHTFSHTIDGKAADSTASFPVVNPFDESVVANCPDASKEQLDLAVRSSQRAYQSWSALPVDQRRAALGKFAKAIHKRVKDIAQVLVLEQGKPIQAATLEVHGALYWIKSTAGLELPQEEIILDNEKTRRTVVYKPLGVVGAITPWNFPVSLAIWKIAPALLAGNTVVLKPSPHTPLTSLLLGECARESLPPGVVNVVAGGNDLGAWMTNHDGIAKISFTGSVPTGMAIQRTCASDLKRVTLELGGNDAAIVLPGTDVTKAAPKIFQGAFANSGQVCSAIKRVYVHKDQYQAFVETIAQVAKATTVGNGMDTKTMLGPINNKMQFDKIQAVVEEAKTQGATIKAGGKPPPGNTGYLFEPTIIADVDESFRIVSEEQFGPALPILQYTTVEEAVQRANDSKFGLSGSVWGKDVDLATQVANKLDVGTAWVNQHLNLTPETPFGGRKWSGIGRENGKWGLNAFLEPKCISVQKKAKL